MLIVSVTNKQTTNKIGDVLKSFFLQRQIVKNGKEKPFNVKMVSQRSGVSVSTISNIIRGDIPSLSVLVKILDVLDVPLHVFFTACYIKSENKRIIETDSKVEANFVNYAKSCAEYEYKLTI